MADHIRTRTAPGTWVVRAGGAVIAESTAAIELTEGSYEPVIYFPRQPSATTSHCPHTGDASYYSIQTKSQLIEDAAWSYDAPLQPVAAIAGHLAFYPDKATVERI